MLLLQSYLGRSCFIIRTDHEALKRLLTSAESSSKPAGWELRQHEFDFKLFHQTRIKQQAPDTMSRSKMDGMDKVKPNKELPVLIFDRTEEQSDVETGNFDEDRPCK